MDFFGLDIGSHTIKAIKLAKNGQSYQLLAFGSSPSNSRGLISEADSDMTALAESIKKLCQTSGIKTKNVVSALPQDQVFTRVITLPNLSETELNSALKWEAEQYVPIPLEEVTLAHQIVGKVKEDNKEKMEVLLVAAPNRLIEKTVEILRIAGLRAVGLETETLAIARSLVPTDAGSIMIVDFGAVATDLAIAEDGQLVFVHSLSTGGEALTRAVAFELGLDPNQAEAYKKAYGVDPEKLEGKVGGAIAPVLEVVVKEMEKAIQFYSARQKTISRIVLTGGSSGLPEIATALAKKLNIEIQIGNSFARIVQDSLVQKVPTADIPLYSVAVGLAMKEI